MPFATFPPYLADLEFEMDVPPGFADPGTPREDVDFENPVLCAPLVLLASPVAAAIITVMARPVYETGSVLQWLRYLTDFHGISLSEVHSGVIGRAGIHPAIIAEGSQQQDDLHLRLTLVAFEDGERFVMAHGLAPQELWPSFGEHLTRAVRSLTLARPKGPTRDLDSTTAIGWRKEDAATPESYEQARLVRAAARRPAVEHAEALIAAGRFDDAEAVIRAADSSIEGAVEIARLYERRLRALIQAGALPRLRKHIDDLLRRALVAAHNCYPDPHTQIEADDFAAAREADTARLNAILERN